MSLKNKLANLRATPSPQILVSSDNNNHENNMDSNSGLRHQHSNSSLAKFFNRSRASSSTSLNNMLSNESAGGTRKQANNNNNNNNNNNKKQSEKLEALQYNKSSLLSPKMSQTSSNSSNSQKSKQHFMFGRNHSQNSSNLKENDDKNKSSKLELKRFFKNVIKPSLKKEHHHAIGQLKDNVSLHHKKHHEQKQQKQQQQTTVEQQLQQTLQEKMLFGAETSQELIRKYGVPGKILGEGAGGSVAIVERPSDGKIFAVKQFRAKNARESDFDYTKKVQSEFFVGSTLHHQNVIETFDMLQEGLKFLIVMEYCPFDFFTIVMSGLLQKNEISCYFKQIVNGVNYLHSMGLAHRDLKLDNCVVTVDGVLKLIDFGSSVVFKYPFEDDLIKAKGVVGSDPYLAPEVLAVTHYDPRPVDIWSIAIIFCCMTLRRFPWKVPKLSDPSYKAFSQIPSSQSSTTLVDAGSIDVQTLQNPDHELSTRELHELQAKTNMISNSTTTAFAPRSKTKGPYRLLRLLPHSSRPLIGAMLELDATKRISIEDVLKDEWFTGIQVCEVNEEKQFVKAENHKHHLVTEEELQKLQEEREKQQKLKEEVAAAS